MKVIPLSQGQVAWVDDEDFEWLTKWKWHYLRSRNTGYAVRCIWPSRKNILMHRVIMKTPKGIEVDHIDHNGCNNQKANLRNCIHAKNTKNHSKHKNNSSGYKGIYWDPKNKKWAAQIRVDGKRLFLGRFDAPELAARAYDEAAHKYFGKYALLNFTETYYDKGETLA